jgi:hypothetical protein
MERGFLVLGRKCNKSPGAPSFALFAKGGIPRISIPTVAYPTLCKKRKGWGTRLFVVLPAVPNTNRGLIENFFLIRKPHMRPVGAAAKARNPGTTAIEGARCLVLKDQAGSIVEKAGAHHL